ncbi:MAG TPA: hypothetical protein VFS42_04255 [Burkholderiaceae bacterium]|nr:hypothetical protein [Burkholderiaceae bacterium]
MSSLVTEMESFIVDTPRGDTTQHRCHARFSAAERALIERLCSGEHLEQLEPYDARLVVRLNRVVINMRAARDRSLLVDRMIQLEATLRESDDRRVFPSRAAVRHEANTLLDIFAYHDRAPSLQA